MEETNEMVKNRIRAYEFIKSLFEQVDWVDADLTKDEELAKTLDVEFDELNMIKEGKINPSEKLVLSIKKFFSANSQSVSKFLSYETETVSEIERILVNPFN